MRLSSLILLALLLLTAGCGRSPSRSTRPRTGQPTSFIPRPRKSWPRKITKRQSSISKSWKRVTPSGVTRNRHSWKSPMPITSSTNPIWPSPQLTASVPHRAVPHVARQTNTQRDGAAGIRFVRWRGQRTVYRQQLMVRMTRPAGPFRRYGFYRPVWPGRVPYRPPAQQPASSCSRCLCPPVVGARQHRR